MNIETEGLLTWAYGSALWAERILYRAGAALAAHTRDSDGGNGELREYRPIAFAHFVGRDLFQAYHEGTV